MRGNFRQGIKFRFVSAATSARSSRVKSFLYCFLTAPIVPPIRGICSDPPLFLSSGPSPVGRRHLRFVAGDPREFVTGNAHCRCESRNDGYLVNGKNENASSRGKRYRLIVLDGRYSHIFYKIPRHCPAKKNIANRAKSSSSVWENKSLIPLIDCLRIFFLTISISFSIVL